MSKHILNKKQTKAWLSLLKAFDNAKKSGLVLYGKCGSLVAYTKDAEKYVNDNGGFNRCLRGRHGEIPHESSVVLNDSSADDFVAYISESDRKKYNPDNF